MPSLPRLFPWCLFAAWGLSASTQAESILNHTEPSGATIGLSRPFPRTSGWCFLPVEITADTPGKEDAQWRVTTSSSNYGNRLNLRTSFTFRARAGTLSRGTALIPMGDVGTDGSYFSGYSSNYAYMEAALIGGGSSRNHVNTLSAGSSSDSANWLTCTESASGATSFTPNEAPGDWRAYNGLAGLTISESSWQVLAPAARTAITQWVRLGGCLELTATKNPGAAGMPRPDTGGDAGPISGGIICKDRGSVNGTKPKDERDWAKRAISGTTLEEWNRRLGSTLLKESSSGFATGLMVLVLLAFAILAGPVNVFVFAAARRRHRLFFTTPVISLATGILLVISVILSDGIGGSGERFVWMESGPAGDNTQYIRQHQHSRCGAMFSTGFEIPEDAYLAPMISNHSESAGNLGLDLATGKVVGSGPWFSSRSSQSFYLAAARPGRGRMEQSGTADRPVLTSAFEFPLQSVFWLAPDGKTWWQAQAMAQGTATVMQPCTQETVTAALTAATANAPIEYHRDLANAIRRPGFFFAIADKISAISTHGSIRWQTHGFVTGPVTTL